MTFNFRNILNVAANGDTSTVEFRGMEGTTDPLDVECWVLICTYLVLLLY